MNLKDSLTLGMGVVVLGLGGWQVNALSEPPEPTAIAIESVTSADVTSASTDPIAPAGSDVPISALRILTASEVAKAVSESTPGDLPISVVRVLSARDVVLYVPNGDAK